MIINKKQTTQRQIDQNEPELKKLHKIEQGQFVRKETTKEINDTNKRYLLVGKTTNKQNSKSRKVCTQKLKEKQFQKAREKGKYIRLKKLQNTGKILKKQTCS